MPEILKEYEIKLNSYELGYISGLIFKDMDSDPDPQLRKIHDSILSKIEAVKSDW